MRWISSAGGPLVLLPSSLASKWQGVGEASESISDYAETCNVRDYTGIISRHGFDVLVLGDEPHATAALADDDGLPLIRWVFAPDEEAVVDCLRHARGLLRAPPLETVDWATAETKHLLFDAGANFETAPDALEVELETAVYRVETHDVQWPTKEARLIVHAFMKQL